eukprot:scaffold60199_cov65-Cyclotella_meneghiniana.AAC.2
MMCVGLHEYLRGTRRDDSGDGCRLNAPRRGGIMNHGREEEEVVLGRALGGVGCCSVHVMVRYQTQRSTRAPSTTQPNTSLNTSSNNDANTDNYGSFSKRVFYLIRTSSLRRHHGPLLIGILANIIPTFIRLRRIFISTLQQNLDGPIETLIQKR